MLTNELSSGDIFLVQVPYVTRTANVDLGISFTWTNPTTQLQSTLSTISDGGVVTSDINTYGGGVNVVAFTVGGTLPKDTPIRLSIAGLQTPASRTSITQAKIRTYKGSPAPSLGGTFNAVGGVLDQGEFNLPAIEPRASTAVSTGTPTSSGTASDGTTYVTAAASSVLISDVANWRYGDDGHVRKCAEPSTLSSNEGNCQSIYRLDASGNVVKSADGNNILLMRKCPWKCNNPGQTGSDACRIDADCLKVTRCRMEHKSRRICSQPHARVMMILREKRVPPRWTKKTYTAAVLHAISVGMDAQVVCPPGKAKDMDKDKVQDYSVQYVMLLEISFAQSVTG